MNERIRIHQVRWLDPRTQLDATGSVVVQSGVPIADDGRGVDREIDGQGLWLVPMLTDLAVHCREPGATHKAHIASEAKAAYLSGIGAIVLSPNTEPAIDSTAVVELIYERASRLTHESAQIYPIAALTKGLAGTQLAELATLTDAGCVAVGMIGKPIADAGLLRRAMQYAAGLGLCVMMQPVDADVADDGCAHEGFVSTRLGLPGIPASAETLALARDLMLAEETGVRLHVCRISAAQSVDLIAAAKARGVPVTCDVAMHQLYLCDNDLIGFSSAFHVYPPLRRAADRDALRVAVGAGLIDAIVSDHQPHDADAKLAPFALSEPGISGLDSFLGLGLKLVSERVLTPLQWLRLCAEGPSEIAGIHLEPRRWMLINPESEQKFSVAGMQSRGKNSPFLGWLLPGVVVARFTAGR